MSASKPQIDAGGSQQVNVSILDRDYLVACGADEKAPLLAAAALLDGRMRALRAQSRGSNTERVAVMAALTLAHEYLLAHEFLELSANSRVADGSVSEHVAMLHRKLDGALAHFIQ